MKAKWPQRAYIGLFSGAGRARVKETAEIVETTAMSVFRLPDPFTKYIFVDSEAQCTSALRHRIDALPSSHDVTILHGDANEIVDDIGHALPPFNYGNGLLSFCFVDPFSAELKFSTIAALGRLRMDFLILLMLGFDARLNFRRYFEDETSTRIADLVDCPTWRADFANAKDRNVVRFLLRKFDEAMIRIGYRTSPPSHYHTVNVRGKGVMQYMLAFYSKHQKGQAFWEKSLTGLSPQIGLPFD
jgi:three-Cys-motif partner protein